MCSTLYNYRYRKSSDIGEGHWVPPFVKKMDVDEKVRMLNQKNEDIAMSNLVFVPGSMHKNLLKYDSI